MNRQTYCEYKHSRDIGKENCANGDNNRFLIHKSQAFDNGEAQERVRSYEGPDKYGRISPVPDEVSN